MIHNRTPEHNSKCLFIMMFNNVLWQVAFTCIASNMNASIMVPQIKAEFVKKHHLPICMPVCMFTNPLQLKTSIVSCERILYKGICAHTIHNALDFNELTKQTVIHLQQRDSVLPTVQMKLYRPSAPCRLSVIIEHSHHFLSSSINNV